MLESTAVCKDIPFELYELKVLTNELVLTVSHYLNTLSVMLWNTLMMIYNPYPALASSIFYLL